MKLQAKDIKAARILSHSPLVISITHSDGSSDSYSLRQMQDQLTPAAETKTRALCGQGHASEWLEVTHKLVEP